MEEQKTAIAATGPVPQTPKIDYPVPPRENMKLLHSAGKYVNMHSCDYSRKKYAR
jgi:hypothetical protein